MGKKTSAADDAVLTQTAAELAAGKDPFGDDEAIVAESIEDQAKAAKAKLDEANGVVADAKEGEGDDAATATAVGDETGDAAKTGDDTPGDKPADDAGDAAADTEGGTTDQGADDAGDEDEDAALEPRSYSGKPVQEMEAKLTELEAREAAEFKKLMAGEIDDDAFSKVKSEVARESRGIQTQIARAEGANDRVLEYQRSVNAQVARTALKDGVVYRAADDAPAEAKATASKNAKQYDVALSMLASDPDNVNRSFKSLAKEAHAMVLARQGIAKAALPAASATKTPVDKTPPARVPAKAPLTLRNVPPAATPQTGGSLTEEMGRLKGPAYQEAYSKLTPAQRAKLLDE